MSGIAHRSITMRKNTRIICVDIRKKWVFSLLFSTALLIMFDIEKFFKHKSGKPKTELKSRQKSVSFMKNLLLAPVTHLP